MELSHPYILFHYEHFHVLQNLFMLNAQILLFPIQLTHITPVSFQRPSVELSFAFRASTAREQDYKSGLDNLARILGLFRSGVKRSSEFRFEHHPRSRCLKSLPRRACYNLWGKHRL